MISTSSNNVSHNLSNVQTADVHPRSGSVSGYVKLPVPAIEFQQQLVQTAQPVDEITIEAAPETENGAVAAQRARTEQHADRLPRASQPASEPPTAKTPAPFPGIDLASEPIRASRPAPVHSEAPDQAEVSRKASHPRQDAPAADQLKLSSEAQIREAELKSAEQSTQVRQQRSERTAQQHAEQAQPQRAASHGNSGPQPFNRLV